MEGRDGEGAPPPRGGPPVNPARPPCYHLAMRLPLRLLAAGALGAGVCALGALHACGSGPTHGAGPSIVTDPATEVAFKGVVRGSTATRPVKVRNLGSSDLTIRSIVIRDDNRCGFALGEDAETLKTVSIAPGDEREFTVTCSPPTSA